LEEYSYKLFTGHILFQVDGKIILLDTGAPTSFGSSFSLMNTEFQIDTSYMGLNSAKLSEFIGTNIDVLIGGDIISQFDISLNPEKQKIEFGNNLTDLDDFDLQLPITNFMNIPIIQVNINGESINTFFDTGAQLSYIEKNFTLNFESKGQKEDFYPGVGRFKTNTFEIPTTIGDTTKPFLFGVLPDILQMTLMMADTNGIIGTEILEHFRFTLSIKNETLSLWKIT
jgi:hypothetical protein